MGVRFHKSVSLGKGAKINFSKSGPSLSVGHRGASLNFSKRGTYSTFGIPGTGLSTRTKIGGSKRSHKSASSYRSSSARSTASRAVSPARQQAIDMLRPHAEPDGTIPLKVDLNDVFLKPVMERALDGAFIAGPVIHPELTSIRLKQERLVLVGSRMEAALSADQILTEAPLTTFPEGSVFRRRLELLLASEKLSFLDRLTCVNSLGAMIATISAGIGCGYLPLSIVEPYVRDGLVSIYPFEDPYSEYDVVFAYRRDHIMDAAFRNFIACVQWKEEELSGTGKDG